VDYQEIVLLPEQIRETEVAVRPPEQLVLHRLVWGLLAQARQILLLAHDLFLETVDRLVHATPPCRYRFETNTANPPPA